MNNISETMGDMKMQMASIISCVMLMLGLGMGKEVVFQSAAQVEVRGLNNTVCPDGSQCPTYHTCCPVRHHLIFHKYVCCPYTSGTCCADQKHCCPEGTRCDASSQTCIQETPDGPEAAPGEPTTAADPPAKAEVDVAKDSPNTICPDGSRCATGYTCCPGRNGYLCCHYNSATCCADRRSCCAHGYHCDLVRHRCLRSANYLSFLPMLSPAITPAEREDAGPLLEEKESTAGEDGDNTICPDGSHCPSLNTCCPKGGRYGCCKYNSGTCCADQNMCCPHGYECDIRTERCNRGDTAVPAIFQQPARFPGHK